MIRMQSSRKSISRFSSIFAQHRVILRQLIRVGAWRGERPSLQDQQKELNETRGTYILQSYVNRSRFVEGLIANEMHDHQHCPAINYEIDYCCQGQDNCREQG